MFKNSRFLAGFGVGMIIGAILLELMNFANYTEKPMDPSNIDQIKELAKANNLKVFTEKEWQTELDQKIKEAKSAPVSTPGKTASAAPVVSPSITPVETPKVPVVTKSVKIVKGMTSSEVTDLLFENGIISDRGPFQEELSNQQLERKIQKGTYTFSSSDKISDMIKTLTTPNQQ